MRGKRNTVKETKELYFCVVGTHLRTKCRWPIPDSDGGISELPSTLSMPSR